MDETPPNEERYSTQSENIGPINLDLIEKDLYLGNIEAAKNIEVLTKFQITHILTIHVTPLPKEISNSPLFSTKFLRKADNPKEDILSHFEECYAFITEGQTKGKVLVHCVVGASRSATVVIAYIMKKYGLSYYDAFKKVKSKRRLVRPNIGFIAQLQLYQRMGCQIDPTNKDYKQYRLFLAVDRMQKQKKLPANIIQPDPGMKLIENESTNVYHCLHCLRAIATCSNVLEHYIVDKVCKGGLFLEPLAWMGVQGAPKGKLLCPKCETVLGIYNWIEGTKCCCGNQIIPAFNIFPSKVGFCSVLELNHRIKQGHKAERLSKHVVTKRMTRRTK